MKLYRISTTSGARWYGTQADAKAGAKQLGTEYAQVEVPTDKPNLLSFLNEHTATDVPTQGRTLDPLEAAEIAAVRAAGRPLNPDVDIADDGHPNRRPAFTGAQVEVKAMGPRSSHVQDLCYHISKLTLGSELGLVALEVAAKFKQIGESHGEG